MRWLGASSQTVQSVRQELATTPARANVFYAAGVCVRTRICNSRNCFSSTSFGALVIRHCARCVLGKAITSRIDSAPAINVTRRSKPNARPPCGGAPYCNASSRKPNFSCASSLLIFYASNTLDCTSCLWIRTEPPPTSQPFNTMS